MTGSYFTLSTSLITIICLIDLCLQKTVFSSKYLNSTLKSELERLFILSLILFESDDNIAISTSENSDNF